MAEIAKWHEARELVNDWKVSFGDSIQNQAVCYGTVLAYLGMLIAEDTEAAKYVKAQMAAQLGGKVVA